MFNTNNGMIIKKPKELLGRDDSNFYTQRHS